MKKISDTIVFFGSGPVAAKSLEKLAPNFNIEAVVTKPAKSRLNDPVPVLNMATKLGLKVFLPANKTELTNLFTSKPINSRIGILVDYGIIVPQSIIDYFPLGIVNSHFSLLPRWRGADPITFSILSGDTETGVSLMIINAKMDEGLLLGQSLVKIDSGTSSESLTDKLIDLSHDLLINTIPEYLDNKIKPYPQPHYVEPTYSRKLTKDDGLIDWQKPAEEIEREIRAYSIWPKSYTNLKDLTIIISKAHVVPESGSPGKFEVKGNELRFFTSNNALVIDRLKPASKNEMDTNSFIAGYSKYLN